MTTSARARHCSAWLLFTVLGLAATPPAPVFGQQTAAPRQSGTIRGKVTIAGSTRPLASAQVSIPGTGRGGLANNAGDFVIENVPVGRQTVRVQMIGYGSVDRPVVVVAGETATVRAELSEQALALDEIVVTGTAGGTQRRAVGNVVDRVTVAKAVEMSPARSVNQLIAQRSPGVMLMGQSGTVGAGAPIHIRGVNSMSLGGTPLIYIDGVRMDSRADQGPSQRGGSRMSRLDDVSLEDIESIEIIKGPAAATLYGTEASNGVIQIVTKRGREGAAQFDISARGGTHFLLDPEGRTGWSYMGDPRSLTAPLDSINLYAQERDFGPWGDPFKYGDLAGVDLNVRGGVERVRYFASTSFQDQTGVIPYNWDKKFSARSNLDAVLTNQVSANISMGYVRRGYRAAQVTNPTDHFGNLVWGGPATLNTKFRGWLNAPPEGSEEVDARTTFGRTTSSLQLKYNPWEWFTHRMVVGLDVGEDNTSTLYPRHPDGSAHWWGGLSLGSKVVEKETNRIITFDYGTSAAKQFTSSLKGTTSAGFQYYKSQISEITSTGQQFAAPPLTTVSAGAIRSGTETFIENATVGVYIQQEAEWRNRMFLTAAVRGDDNSAFGAEYQAAIYPKLSGTWVLHEEDFWKWDFVNQFRLRGAWGAAGQQPATFAAVQLYAPITGFNNEPGLMPDKIGNPTLKPERSEELEVGFDLGLWDDRVQVVFTRYQRAVKDALIDRPLPPSAGFIALPGSASSGTQTVNIGRIKSWGNEVSINSKLLQGDNFGWDFGISFATMRNRIEDLGDAGEGLAAGFDQQLVGYSISDLFWPKVLSAEFESGNFGPVKNIKCDGGTGESGREPGGVPVDCAVAPYIFIGHSQPTWQMNINQTFTVLQRLRFAVSVDATGGNYQQDSTAPAAHTSYCTTRACRIQDDPIVQAYRAIGRNPLGTYDASFAKLREVSATYSLPNWLAGRMGARSGSVSLAGRNLMMLWTGQMGWDTPRSGLVIVPLGEGKVWDPETRGTGDRSSGYQTVMPPLTSAVLTVRMGF